jgi:hypothetical protein
LTGHIALGWRLEKPEVLSGSIMENSNIIIGHQFENGTQYVRDDYGVNSNHFDDTVLNGQNDLVFSSVINDVDSVSMEFVYPLVTTDNVSTLSGILADVNLTVDSNNWAYFIMSATETTDENLMTYHTENRHIISKPVYLQKSGADSYPN